MRWTRRRLLSTGAMAAAALGAQAQRANAQTPRKLPSERKDYRDRVTEFVFARVNAPTASAWLPAATSRMFARRGRFLLHASDRGGSVQAWAMDLKSGELRLLTNARALDAASLCLTADERSFCYVDGAALYVQGVGKDAGTKLADLPGHVPGAGVSTAYDNQHAVLVSANRLLRVNLVRPGAAVLHAAAASAQLRGPRFHPRRNEVAYFENGALWTMRTDGGKPQQAPLAAGRVLDAHWTPNLLRDAASVVYLHQPDEAGRTVNLREYDFVAKRDRLIALTSQFASFSPNSDASVFAGASFSRAQPYLLMLVRSVARELTLAEHAAKDAAQVAPVFTPDSQQIFWQSDREGKPCIYSIAVEKLVEATEDDEKDGTKADKE